jgi:hypothetical protein
LINQINKQKSSKSWKAQVTPWTDRTMEELYGKLTNKIVKINNKQKINKVRKAVKSSGVG